MHVTKSYLLFFCGMLVGSLLSSDVLIKPADSSFLVSEIVSLPTIQKQKRSSFTDLLIKSKSDKYFTHHYERYYSTWLAPFREREKIKFLEIGADQGYSLELWASYFDNDPESIVGLSFGRKDYEVVQPGNIFFNSSDRGKRSSVRVVYGDQSTIATMKTLSEMGPWDIIIDDGSHVPSHVLFSLFSLWPKIKPGGLYVIEDIETSYWRANSVMYKYKMRRTGFMSDSRHSVVYKLKEIIDVMIRNQLGLNPSDLSVMPGDDEICSIEWGMNIVKLRKCGPEDGVGPILSAGKLDGSKAYDPDDLSLWLSNCRDTNPKSFLHQSQSEMPT